jgi:SSS family solute:Na+ symporter
VGVEDYYRRLRPDATDQQRLKMGKIIVAVCGLLSVAIAAVIAWKSERVLSFYFTVTSIVAGGLAGLFLLAFLSPRANRQGAYIGIAACLAFTTWATLTSGKTPAWDLGAWNYTLHTNLIGGFAHIVLLVTGYVASFFFAAPEAVSQSVSNAFRCPSSLIRS